MPTQPIQQSLFSDRGTNERSLEAYETIDLKTRQSLVYQMIRLYPVRGCTLDELTRLLGWPVNQISGRVTELVKKGRCRRGPDTRPTRTGRMADVIRANEQ
jgi:hypothetical protein